MESAEKIAIIKAIAEYVNPGRWSNEAIRCTAMKHGEDILNIIDGMGWRLIKKSKDQP